MNELIKVNYENDRPTVSGRDLHNFLEVKTAYKDWFPRMCEYGFVEDIEKMRKNKITSVDFKDRLKQVLMYYFWAKCEYEVIVSSFPPDEKSKDEKVDIYSQVMLNFDIFCDYVYSNIFETKKK